MATIKEFFASISRNRELRKRIVLTILLLAIFRLVTHVPVPGVNSEAIRAVFANNQLLSLLDIFIIAERCRCDIESNVYRHT